MPATTMLHVRIDEATKSQATETLAAAGLSLSDAVRLFLRRVVIEQALPLSLKVPNAETRAAMLEARAIGQLRFGRAEDLIGDLEKNTERAKG